MSPTSSTQSWTGTGSFPGSRSRRSSAASPSSFHPLWRENRRRPHHAGGSRGSRLSWRWPALGFVGLIGNVALADADRAAGLRQWNKVASEARRAHRWAPWSTEPLHLLAEAQYARDDLAAARSTLREALAKDPANWQLWFNLAAATQGEERARALAKATRLNPLSPQIAIWRNTLPKVAK